MHHWFNWYLKSVTHDTEDAIRRGALKEGRQQMIVWHPHGAFTIGALYVFSHFFAKDYPFKGQFVVIADLLLRVPGLSEYLLLCNARNGSSSTFNALLEQGHSVAVQPGGLIEQVSTDSDREQIFFPPKLGFIRLAIKHGVPMLPLYVFGENQLFKTEPWTRRVNAWLYKNLSMGSMVVIGRGGLPNSPILPNPLLMPDPQREIHMRYGESVEVGPPDDNPSEEKVLQVFESYKAALQALFEKHKDTCLPPHVAAGGLEIIWRGDKVPAPAVRSSL